MYLNYINYKKNRIFCNRLMSLNKRDDYTKMPLIVIEKLYVLKKLIKSFETFNPNWSVSETKLI